MVYKYDSNAILDRLELEDDVKRRIARALDELGEHALPWFLGALSLHQYADACPAIISVLAEDPDYEHRRVLCSKLMGALKDINKPEYEPYSRVLLKMGKTVAVYAHDILRYNWSDEGWIQGICILLSKMAPADLTFVLHPLLDLLELGTDERPMDEHAIMVLRRIGSPEADAAIPKIAALAISPRNVYAREDAIKKLSQNALFVVLCA